jgi:hypothetical protein
MAASANATALYRADVVVSFVESDLKGWLVPHYLDSLTGCEEKHGLVRGSADRFHPLLSQG